MTAPHIADPASLLGEALPEASPGLMRHLLQTMLNALLSADADAVMVAEWGQPARHARPTATATTTATSTPASAPPRHRCVEAALSRLLPPTGSWNDANEPSPHSTPSS